MIQELSKLIRRHKKAKQNDQPVPAARDALFQARLEINKFQRTLLLRLHKDAEFSDTVIRQVEREMDIDELKLNLHVPAEE
jgi:hypothetical protein